VTKAGVGTNRYAYSFNDPVKLSDPGGNAGAPDSAWMSEDVNETKDDEGRVDGFPEHIERLNKKERDDRFK